MLHNCLFRKNNYRHLHFCMHDRKSIPEFLRTNRYRGATLKVCVCVCVGGGGSRGRGGVADS